MTAIAANLQRIQADIEAACQRVGRNPQEVTLVAVTKQRSIEEIQAVIDAGYTHLGENRMEEAELKIPAFPTTVTWHMIGHVQSRKAKPVITHFPWIHSLESLKLARRYDEFARERGQRPHVLLEMNVSGEASKSGIPALGWQDSATVRASVWEFVASLREYNQLQVEGLMTMAPLVEDEATIRACFRSPRELRDALATDFPEFNWPTLSMGMSHDYPLAIEEGATLIRVGTAIFA